MKDKKVNQDDENQPKEQEVQAECARCAEYLAGWKRAKADYENLKKQSADDKINFAKYAHEKMLADLLPAIDQFEMALNHIPDTSDLPATHKKQIDNWIIGIKAVNSLWQQMFDEIGLQKIPTDGEFDPNLHSAVSQETDPQKPEGAILKTIQNGYMLKETVLRPAKVVVNSSNQATQ